MAKTQFREQEKPKNYVHQTSFTVYINSRENNLKVKKVKWTVKI